MDVACTIWVVITPHLDEVLNVVVSDAAAVLPLNLLETLESDGYKQVYENNQHHKHIHDEKETTQVTVAAPDSNVSS